MNCLDVNGRIYSYISMSLLCNLDKTICIDKHVLVIIHENRFVCLSLSTHIKISTSFT